MTPTQPSIIVTTHPLPFDRILHARHYEAEHQAEHLFQTPLHPGVLGS